MIQYPLNEQEKRLREVGNRNKGIQAIWQKLTMKQKYGKLS